MNTAIIAEYNPFHKGHKYHIEKTRAEGSKNIIAIMSGNFVQRGEPALIEKHIRTKAALINGVDMVLELPVEYATSGADIFSRGACDIIKKCGIADSISFGSESGSVNDFVKIAKLLNNETAEFKNIIKEKLNRGISYPSARTAAIGKYFNMDSDFLKSSNNILALEYIRNICDTHIKPIAVRRIVSEYNNSKLTGNISSASSIRLAIMNKNEEAFDAVPENTLDIIKHIKHIPHIDDFSQILHYILRTNFNLNKYADITEGLENRIISTADNQKISQLIEDIKTKRYTYSKIKRALLHIILGITKDMQNTDGVKYIRVLGVRKDRIKLLSELNEKASVPVITKVKENENLLRNEIMATDIYNVIAGKKSGEEYKTPMIIL